MAKLAHASESVIAIAFLVRDLAEILWLFMDSADTAIVHQRLRLTLGVYKLHPGMNARRGQIVGAA